MTETQLSWVVTMCWMAWTGIVFATGYIVGCAHRTDDRRGTDV